ncbi:MAG TPA: sigma 54-interacting transcriptional regulator [Gallionellaceae bacterium]|nr:sigma 54-interacting transcriptional regulator [Gallionellaceae bacterium]
MIGKSQAFLNLLNLIQTISNSDAPVLIEGEKGSGKASAARAIHAGSKRKAGPFVSQDCVVIPDAEFESELLGHFSGMATEARDEFDDSAESAEGGTLFLDDVDALSSLGQAALLRFLQGQRHPSGGPGGSAPDVRIIAACSTDLAKLSAQGVFRQDLYSLLTQMRLKVPPLRDRKGDAALLAAYFLRNCAVRYGTERHLDAATIEWIENYSWPGNIRELENLISREYLTAGNSVIHIPSPLVLNMERRKQADRRFVNITELNFNQAKSRAIGEFERSYLDKILTTTEGNVTRAANLVGKERRSLGKLLKKHGIDRHQYVERSGSVIPSRSATSSRPAASRSASLPGRMSTAGLPEVQPAPLLPK